MDVIKFSCLEATINLCPLYTLISIDVWLHTAQWKEKAGRKDPHLHFWNLTRQPLLYHSLWLVLLLFLVGNMNPFGDLNVIFSSTHNHQREGYQRLFQSIPTTHQTARQYCSFQNLFPPTGKICPQVLCRLLYTHTRSGGQSLCEDTLCKPLVRMASHQTLSMVIPAIVLTR